MRRGMIITGFWTLKFVWHVARIDFIALLLMQLHELFNMAVNVRFACLLYGVFVVVCLVRMAAAAVRTFLQFRCNHWRTTSKPCNDSGDWKKSTLGPPSFFGPNDAILTNLSLECTEKFCNLCYTPLKQTNTDASVFFLLVAFVCCMTQLELKMAGICQSASAIWPFGVDADAGRSGCVSWRSIGFTGIGSIFNEYRFSDSMNFNFFLILISFHLDLQLNKI